MIFMIHGGRRGDGTLVVDCISKNTMPLGDSESTLVVNRLNHALVWAVVRCLRFLELSHFDMRVVSSCHGMFGASVAN